ncbi:hypothetical protein EJ08DRAFT_599031, partial [Tothia fuscella]
SYLRFGGFLPGHFLASFTAPGTGHYVYPLFDGFQIDTSCRATVGDMTLQPRMSFGRFGSEYGTLMERRDAPYTHRSLAQTNLNAASKAMHPLHYRQYEVTR